MKPAFRIFPGAAENIEHGKCPMCGAIIEGFRDALSEKEYTISGLCQACQDSVFGGGDGHE